MSRVTTQRWSMEAGGGRLSLHPLLFSLFFLMQPRMRMEQWHLGRALRWALLGGMHGGMPIGTAVTWISMPAAIQTLITTLIVTNTKMT